MHALEIPDFLKNVEGDTATDQGASPQLQYIGGTLSGTFELKTDPPENLGREINIVILGIDPPQPRLNRRVMWEGELSDPESHIICDSVDGTSPSSWVENPPANSCRLCPNAVPGSGRTARSQACGAHKLIYCFLHGDMEAGIMCLKVPVTALKSLGKHRFDVKRLGVPIASIVTLVDFDPEFTAYSRQRFRVAGFLNEDDYGKAAAAAQDAHTYMQVEAPRPPSEAPRPLPESPSSAVEAKALPLIEAGDVIEGLLNDKKDDEAEENTPPPEGPPVGFLRADKSPEEVETAKTVEFLLGLLEGIDTTVRMKLFVQNALGQLPREAWPSSLVDKIKEKTKQLVEGRPAFAAAIARLGKKDFPVYVKKLVSKGVSSSSPEGMAFTARVTAVNGLWDPNKHAATTKGFPAFLKSGDYRKKKINPLAKSQVEVDEDLLAELGLDEV